MVERAQGGDVEAYEALVRASTRRLYLTADRIVRDAERLSDRAPTAPPLRVREIPVEDVSIPAAEDAVDATDLRDQLDRAMGALPDGQRAVVVLHHFVGLPLIEIAEILGAPAGTVRSRGPRISPSSTPPCASTTPIRSRSTPNPRDAVMPDVPMLLSSTDFFAGRDPVLDAALSGALP